MSPEEIQTLADQIAAILKETEAIPRQNIYRMIELAGPDFAHEMLALAQEIDGQGGMLVSSGGRKRTLGGIFFYLAKDAVSDELRKQIFPQIVPGAAPKKPKKSPPAAAQAPAPAPLAPFEWEGRIALLNELAAETGAASTSKIVLLGRPHSVQQRGDFVQLALTHHAGAATLPRGVPRVELPEDYTVYVPIKQWKRPADQLAASADDMLIIEGSCAVAGSAVNVYATSVTTRELQRQRFAKQNSSG